MQTTKNILVAPLNWGLGHATRCIPIINALENAGYTPILASDGVALALLRKEFPHLLALELPSYDVKYAKKASNFLITILKQVPKIAKSVKAENKIINRWIDEYKLVGIVSDNRLGCYSKRVPSVIISHQLQVLAGKTTGLSTYLHQYFIKKYKECWVPDVAGENNLSGKLGHLKNASFPVKYMGIISRFSPKEAPKVYDLLVLLSGPEPQRTLLEELLKEQLKNYPKKVLFVSGVVEHKQKTTTEGSITYCNFLTSEKLEQAILQSDLVLSRSGYTTVLDLAKLQKKAFFIPTPGQFEQEYLAKRLQGKSMIPMAKQDNFKVEMLSKAPLYKGFEAYDTSTNWGNLFQVFE